MILPCTSPEAVSVLLRAWHFRVYTAIRITEGTPKKYFLLFRPPIKPHRTPDRGCNMRKGVLMFMGVVELSALHNSVTGLYVTP